MPGPIAGNRCCMVISVSVAYTVVVCIAGTVVTDPIVVCVGIVVPVFFAVLTFTVLIINHICGLDYIVLISVLSGVADVVDFLK